MSYAGGIAAAAAAKKKREQEEEKMTLESYNKKDLDGWEFKIVRSSFNSFGNPEKMRKVVDEEAQAGWELLEKLDNARLRFKRRTSNRSGDKFRQTDAYRSNSGVDSEKLVLILGLVLAVLGVAAFFIFGGHTIEISNPPVFLSTVGILLLIVLVIIIKRKNR